MSDFDLPASASNLKKPTKNKMFAADLPKEEKADSSTDNLNDKPKPKYTDDELMVVFDEIIFSGEYREEYVIKNKVKVAFKTRTAEQINAIQRVIDGAGYHLISSVETAKSIMNLQYSLVFFKDKELSVLKDEDRAKFIEQLPGPVVGMLIDLLSKFDEKVILALKEGEENF